MSDSHEIPWKRITAEGLAIVASILLAFSIDAWWDEYIEEQRERDILLALLDDFEKSRSSFIEWREFHVAVQASTIKLLQASMSEANALSEPELNRLLLDISWWDVQSHFTTGALNSLVFGGELAVIEDDALRQMLADWPSQLDFLESTQRQDYDFFFNVWMPYLRANGYLPKITTFDAQKPGRPKENSVVIDLTIQGGRSHLDMIRSENFHNVLVQKSWIQFDILIEFENTVNRIEETVRQIETIL